MLESAEPAEPLPYRWTEPLTHPRHGWAGVRVFAVPALIIACTAWLSFPRIASEFSSDRDFAVSLEILEVLGGFELLVLAMFALDRRTITLGRGGLRVAGAGGLLPGRTIPLSSIGAVHVEGERGEPSNLRLTPRAAGMTAADETIGLGNDERIVRAVQDGFLLLGITVEERAPRPAPPMRNVVLGRIVVYGLIALNFVPDSHGSPAGPAARTPAPLDVDPSVLCITRKPGGVLSVEVASVERLVEVRIQSRTIGARAVRIERIGPSLIRLTFLDRPNGTTLSGDGESSETLTVFSRSADGTTHSGWAVFDSNDRRVQGYGCSQPR